MKYDTLYSMYFVVSVYTFIRNICVYVFVYTYNTYLCLK